MRWHTLHVIDVHSRIQSSRHPLRQAPLRCETTFKATGQCKSKVTQRL